MYSSSSGLSSYDPSSYSRRGKADRAQKEADSYDFDISSDGYAESPVLQSTRRMRETNYDSMAASRFSGTTRRSSIDDRAKEILERSRASKPAPREEVDYKSLQSEFAELLQGVQLPESKAPDELESTRISTSSESPSPRGMPMKYASTNSLGSLGSPDGDSLDISAADLEVGAFAARKMKEKAAERRRRMSFDQPMYTPPKEALGSASPDVHKFRRASMGPMGSVGTFQMSTALSSIHQSKASFDSNRYGTAERSDDDIYKMLNITAQGHESSAEVDRHRIAQDLSGPTAAKAVDRDVEEDEDFADDFEAHDEDEEEHKEPVEKNVAAREYEGDYTEDYEYTDDFEEHSPARPSQPPFPVAAPATGLPLHPSTDSGRMNTVEQIMQRWYTDPSGASESVTMAVSSPDMAPLTSAGANVEKEEREEEEEEKLDSPIFAHLKPQLLSGDDHTPQESTLAEDVEPSRAEEEGGRVAATGNSNLVTSISTAAPLMSALSLPSWTAEDFGGGNDRHAESDDEGSQRSGRSRESRQSFDSRSRGNDSDREERAGYRSDSSVDSGRREITSNERKESISDKLPPRGSVTFSANLERVFKPADGKPDVNAAPVPAESQPASEPRDVRRSSRSSRYDDAGDEDDESADADMDLKAMRRNFVPTSKVPSSAPTTQSMVRRVPASADVTRPRSSSEAGRASVARSLASSTSSVGRRESTEKRATQSPGKAKLAASALAKIQRRRAGEQTERKARPATAPESRQGGARNRAGSHTPTRSPARSREGRVSQDGVFAKLLLDAVEKVRAAGANADEGYGLLSGGAESELKNVVRDLMADVHTLQSKERELALREKTIAIKEAVVSARDRGVGLSQSMGWRELQERLTVLQLENDKLLEERDALMRQAESQSRELDRLKAQAFCRQQDEGLAENQAHRQSLGLAPASSLAALHAPLETLAKAAELQKAYKRLSERVAAPQAGVPALASKGLGSDNAPAVTVAREDLETLLRDYATQERLLDGFGKENERLAQQLKEREAAFCAREALFLDRQEAQNKELNYLRGRAGPADTRSLRNELALDAKLRFLQEQLAEQAEAAGQRERALQQTVSTLRAEVKTLNEELDRLRDTDVEQVRQEAQSLRAERTALQEKMRWLLENQRLVDADTEELHKLRKEVQRLRDEVVRRGGPRALDKLKESATAADHADTDRGNSSTLSTSTGGGGGRRNANDVRRIKELEATVRDLREAMAKRYPDSLAGLIHAAKKDKEESREITGLREKIHMLQTELDDARDQYERKLRAMRQEFERAKAAFAAASEANAAVGSTSPSASPLSPTAAREGAGEVERVRQFYTRKIEDLTRRHEQQLRALKRGADFGRDIPPPPPPPPPPSSVGAGEEELLRKRIQLLEEELMQSAREVGTLRARLASQDPSTPAPPPTPAPAQLTREDVDRLVEERVREAVARATPPTPIPAPAPAPMTPLPIPQTNVADLEKVAALWLAEKEKYILEVRSERARADDLARELASLHAQIQELSAQRQQLKPPSLLQFQLLEQQLREVEAGLRRRERDLLAALEESKAAAALERRQQEARHAAELGEKDRLLEKFARDLQLLLAELRRWQQAQGAQ